MTIGDENTIREYTTITRATGINAATVIGNRNYIMTYVHVAHNVKIGSDIVITSGTQLGGNTEVDDFATIGGLVGIHQYCRVGRLAMVGAASYLNKDFPPFFIGRGNPCRVRGVNLAGLRRNNMIKEYEVLKDVYKTIYRSKLNLRQAAGKIAEKYQDNECVNYLLNFIKESRRGINLKH